MLFIYLNGVYESSSTRRIVHALVGGGKLRRRVRISSTKVLDCREKRLPSDHVQVRTSHHNCGLARHSHPIYARSFCRFSVVVNVSSHGVRSLVRHTPSLRARGGVRHVASCYHAGITSCIPSPCCNNTRKFRGILSVLRSTYTKLLASLIPNG